MELCESEYRQVRGTDDDEVAEDIEPFVQMKWVNRFFSTIPPHEEVGPS